MSFLLFKDTCTFLNGVKSYAFFAAEDFPVDELAFGHCLGEDDSGRVKVLFDLRKIFNQGAVSQDHFIHKQDIRSRQW